MRGKEAFDVAKKKEVHYCVKLREAINEIMDEFKEETGRNITSISVDIVSHCRYDAGYEKLNFTIIRNVDLDWK